MTALGIVLIVAGLVTAIDAAPRCRPCTEEGYRQSTRLFLGLALAYVTFSLMMGWVS